RRFFASVPWLSPHWICPAEYSARCRLANLLAGARIAVMQPARQSMTDINLCAFTGPETAPIQRAQEAGWFAEEGLTVHCEVATGSIMQMVGLIEGAFDMAMSAVDNVVAYNEGQGAATPKNQADLVVVLGCAS